MGSESWYTRDSRAPGDRQCNSAARNIILSLAWDSKSSSRAQNGSKCNQGPGPGSPGRM
jgi:hypothetical protein